MPWGQEDPRGVPRQQQNVDPDLRTLGWCPGSLHLIHSGTLGKPPPSAALCFPIWKMLHCARWTLFFNYYLVIYMFFLEKYKVDLNDIKIYLWYWHLDITSVPISTNLFLDVYVCLCVCVCVCVWHILCNFKMGSYCTICSTAFFHLIYYEHFVYSVYLHPQAYVCVHICTWRHICWNTDYWLQSIPCPWMCVHFCWGS